jgi:hypothetical protein
MHEQAHAIADQVGCGQVATNQQGRQVDDQIDIINLRPLRLKGDHVGKEIVLRNGAPLLHQGVHIEAQGFRAPDLQLLQPWPKRG